MGLCERGNLLDTICINEDTELTGSRQTIRTCVEKSKETQLIKCFFQDSSKKSVFLGVTEVLKFVPNGRIAV
jgi:hypothetical protein